MKTNKISHIPTVMVVFGATGDLMSKKITSSLYFLYKSKKLPKLFQVLGFSLGKYTDIQFRNYIYHILKDKKMVVSKKNIKGFLDLFHFEHGLFDKVSSYSQLSRHLNKIDESWNVCSNKIFYLAVPPRMIGPIAKNLHNSGLTDPCGGKKGWSRVMVEKPFGRDQKSAMELEKQLSFLKESQIYRLDHYLGKEMVQGILNFRFSNMLMEDSWNNKNIEKIEMKLIESVGVEDRGNFYDEVGALRDVGQNHLLEVISLLTMENPGQIQGDEIRKKRVEILKKIPTPTLQYIKKNSFRAQYEGYNGIKGVKPNSDTETYFKFITEIDKPRWRGVPIIIESGKRLGKASKEMVVTFKHPRPCMCLSSDHVTPKVMFTLHPTESIRIEFWSKKPGLKPVIEKRSLDFMLYKKKDRRTYVEEYAKLINDCIAGDQSWFVLKDEVKAMWRIVDPVVKAWKGGMVPLHKYKPDSKEILEIAEKTFEDVLNGNNKQIGIVGLGKMGGNIARRLTTYGWEVVGYNKQSKETKDLMEAGVVPSYSPEELVSKLSKPRCVWIMVPAGKPVDDVIFGKDGLAKFLSKGDTIIDGGNSFYKNSIERHKKLKKLGINFIDCGVSGGPCGALDGACLMIGGKKKLFKKFEYLFKDMSQENGYQFFEGDGAGHFVKMVHNGIEYGMMQAIAEGFTILKKSKFKLDLKKVADVYNSGSVIESRLIQWLWEAFDIYGEDLKAVSGKVAHSGEGEWTHETAKELKIKDTVIREAFQFRVNSQEDPSYTGKIVSGLRGQFGQHPIK